MSLDLAILKPYFHFKCSLSKSEVLPLRPLAQLRLYLLQTTFGDCFPLFMNREGKEPFLGWDSSYPIVNVSSGPDAHALKMHLPPPPIRRPPVVARGCWLPANLYLRERSLTQYVSQWSGELLTQWTNSCSSLLVWVGQALFILTVTRFQHSVLLQDSKIYKSLTHLHIV